MKTIYTNLNNKEITEQEITPEDGYYKIFKNDQDKIVKEEYYKNTKLLHTYFYVDLGAKHQDILDINSEGSIVIIEIERINENYSKHFLFGYFNGILKNRDFSIYDNNGYCLMIQDIENSLLSRNETLKFYDSNGYIFEFEYSNDGELSSIDVSNKAINFFERYKSSELNLIPNFEWWDRYSYYYLNTEPAIPHEVIIIYES